MKKIFSFALVFAMLFSLVLGVAPVAEEASELKISYANLEFEIGRAHV